MYYIYIIYSKKSDLYYIGYSSNPFKRVQEHNENPFNTFTSKHRPWVLKTYFECSYEEDYVNKVEFQFFCKK